jgi:hypothetical protein
MTVSSDWKVRLLGSTSGVRLVSVVSVFIFFALIFGYGLNVLSISNELTVRGIVIVLGVSVVSTAVFQVVILRYSESVVRRIRKKRADRESHIE